MTQDSTSFDHWLRHVVNTLKNQDFIFIADNNSVLQGAERQLARLDADLAKLAPWLMRLGGYIHGVPGSVQAFMSRCTTVKTEATDTAAAERLLLDMKEHFPLSALRISPGTRYFACLQGDHLTSDQLQHKAEVFADLVWGMKQVFGKTKMRTLNIPLQTQEQHVAAGLCLTFTDRRAFDAMATSVSALKLRSLTLGERLQLLKMFVPLWSMLSTIKGTVYLEKIVYRTYDNHIESSRPFLFRGTWGFKLNDLVLSGPSST